MNENEILIRNQSLEVNPQEIVNIDQRFKILD